MARTILACAHKFTQETYTLMVQIDVNPPEVLNFNVTPNVDYFASGDDSITEGDADYIKVFEDTLNTNSGGGIFTVTLLDTGKVQVDCTLPHQVLWDDPLTTLHGELFGFRFGVGPPTDYFGPGAPAPAIIENTVTSPRTVSTWWNPDREYSRINYGEPELSGYATRAISQTTLGWMLSDVSNPTAVPRMWRLLWIFVDKSNALIRFATSDIDDPSNCIEYLWLTYLATFCRFRLYETISDRDTYVTLRLVDNARPWELEEEQRLTSYRVEVRAFQVT